MNRLSLYLFGVIIATEIVHAIEIVVVLGVQLVKNQAKTLFIGILLTIAVLCFKISLHTLGLWDLDLFRYFLLAVDTLLPTLLYLYVLSVTGSALMTKRFFLYLLPTLIFSLYALTVYLLTLRQPGLALENRLAGTL